MQQIVIVFHAYPQKPCIDGLVSAIITASTYKSCNVTLVPYWRTDACFQNVKKAVESVGVDNAKMIYVDCSPDLPQETEYLASILNRVTVEVYDHHPRKDDSPMNNLLNLKNFTFSFDAENCAAVMMYNLLSPEKKAALQIEELLKVIQYSEYVGMNPKVAGKKVADEISQRAFYKAMEKYAPTSSLLLKNMQEILCLKMQLFYVLDNIVAKEDQWSFLYSTSSSSQEITKKFKAESARYLEVAKKVISGDKENVFSEKETGDYLLLIEDMVLKLKTGKVMKNCMVGEKTCDVLVVLIDIFTYGRSLEPYVNQMLKEVGASYAILVNAPTTNSKGDVSYYFSLRRLDENFDARDLAKFVMKKSGSTIGGGHPWASGVTLNEGEYKTFIAHI